MTLSQTPLDSAAAVLRDALGERVILAGDDGYDAARTPWNLAVDQRPFAVARPGSAEEVADVVRAAAAAGLRVAPQSTGHAAGALADTDLSRAVLVSLARLRGATVDAQAGTATVLGGSLWADVLDAAAPHGLTALHGSAADVSVVGYSLSGGLSFYGRRHGVAANAVRSVRLVTAAGDVVTASAAENPDLFWAVRGGSGAFGVVVSAEIDLLPYADVFAGMLLWDAVHASEVAHAWAQWSRSAPESATTSFRIMHFPPLPELPPFLSGRSVAVIDGAILEDDADAAALLAPLRAFEPELDTFARIPSAALVGMHMDPPEPSPAASGHAMLSALPPAAVDAFVAAAMAAGPTISELRHLGGAFARRPEEAGAVGSVLGDYLLGGVGMVPAPELFDASMGAVDSLVAALAPWHEDALALTFIDAGGVPRTPGLGPAAARLRELKRAFDPADTLAAAHGVD